MFKKRQKLYCSKLFFKQNFYLIKTKISIKKKTINVNHIFFIITFVPQQTCICPVWTPQDSPGGPDFRRGLFQFLKAARTHITADFNLL